MTQKQPIAAATDAQVFVPVIGGRISVSVGEFAKLTGYGRTFLYAEIKLGRLRVVKHGRRTSILAEDGLQWLRGDAAAGQVNRERSLAS